MPATDIWSSVQVYVLDLERGRVLENSDWLPVQPDPLEAESALTQAAAHTDNQDFKFM